MDSNNGSRSIGKSSKAIEPDDVDSTDPSFISKDGHGGPLSAEDELAGAFLANPGAPEDRLGDPTSSTNMIFRAAQYLKEPHTYFGAQ